MIQSDFRFVIDYVCITSYTILPLLLGTSLTSGTSDGSRMKPDLVPTLANDGNAETRLLTSTKCVS